MPRQRTHELTGARVDAYRHNPGIFARLRSFALDLLRSSGVTNIAEALYDKTLSFDRILSCVGAI